MCASVYAILFLDSDTYFRIGMAKAWGALLLKSVALLLCSLGPSYYMSQKILTKIHQEVCDEMHSF